MIESVFALVGPILSPARSLPLPRVVAIEAAENTFILIGWSGTGEYAGDTWHQSLEEATSRAALEYGAALGPWRELPDGLLPSSSKGLTYLLSQVDRNVPAVECEALASALSGRLAAIAPSPFTIVSDPAGEVTIFDGVTWATSEVCAVIDQDGDWVHLVGAACAGVMDTIQDFIAETTGQPWPADRPPLPTPSVSITTGVVELKYGDGPSAIHLPPLTYKDLHKINSS